MKTTFSLHAVRAAFLVTSALALAVPVVHAQTATALTSQTATTAVKLPPAYTLHYSTKGKAKGINYSANSVLTWAPNGSSYRASVKTTMVPLGSRTQSSEGAITAQGLKPQRMIDRWVRGKTTQMSGNTIKFQDEYRPQVSMLPGAQDQVSLAIQASGWITANPSAFTPGKRVALQVVGFNHAPVWQFNVGQPQSLTINGNTYTAVYMRQAAQAGQTKTTEVWFVPATIKGQATYIPARIRVTSTEGEYVEQLAKALPS